MTSLCGKNGRSCSAKANHCTMNNQTNLICSTAAVTDTPHPLADSKESLQTLNLHRPRAPGLVQPFNESNAVKNSYKMSAQAACSGTMAATYNNSPLLTIAIQLSAIIQASLCALRNKAIHFCRASKRVWNKLGPDRTAFLLSSLFSYTALFLFFF